MDYARQMGFKYPETSEERRAGMAAFRATMLAAHKRALARATNPREIEMQRELIATIEAAQLKFGER